MIYNKDMDEIIKKKMIKINNRTGCDAKGRKVTIVGMQNNI